MDTSIINKLDLNNHVLKAQIASSSKPKTNSSKVFRIPREETHELYIILYENGIISFEGVDKKGLKTTSFSNVPYSEHIADAFGDNWRDKVSKAQAYTDKQLLDINQVKERISLDKERYSQATQIKPISTFTRM